MVDDGTQSVILEEVEWLRERTGQRKKARERRVKPVYTIFQMNYK